MINPLGAMLLVKKIQKGDKTTSTGLVISASFSDSGPAEGVVIKLGTGEQNYKGEILPIPVIEVGDVVLFPDHSAVDVEDEDGTKYLLINSKNVLAIKNNN
jgi:co-chaperonin GroES (HSP10)